MERAMTDAAVQLLLHAIEHLGPGRDGATVDALALLTAGLPRDDMSDWEEEHMSYATRDRRRADVDAERWDIWGGAR
jgi:hypothetical protein